MRGKVSLGFRCRFSRRITPAYAGKSFFVKPRFSRSRDHPRLCGEKVILNRFTAFTIGSPPPMRGKVEQREQMQISIRITPAYAGKSFFDDPPESLFEDHPRLCGEKRICVQRN